MATISVITKVYYCPSPTDETTEVEVRYEERLDTKDDLLKKKMFIGSAPTLIDFAWLKDISYVLIKNLIGVDRQVHPTEEERNLDKISDVLLTYEYSRQGILISPGQGVIIKPNDSESLVLASANKMENIPILLVAYPGGKNGA